MGIYDEDTARFATTTGGDLRLKNGWKRACVGLISLDGKGCGHWDTSRLEDFFSFVFEEVH
ncbi:hypothetical protein D3C85_1232090 [compost metagenome]